MDNVEFIDMIKLKYLLVSFHILIRKAQSESVRLTTKRDLGSDLIRVVYISESSCLLYG